MDLDCKCERSEASLIEYLTFENHVRMFCFRNQLLELLGSLMTPAVVLPSPLPCMLVFLVRVSSRVHAHVSC